MGCFANTDEELRLWEEKIVPQIEILERRLKDNIVGVRVSYKNCTSVGHLSIYLHRPQEPINGIDVSLNVSIDLVDMYHWKPIDFAKLEKRCRDIMEAL